MSIAAHNRGSRLVAREADERMPVATCRADAHGSIIDYPWLTDAGKAVLGWLREENQ